MTYPYSPDDRPDPSDRQPTVRARVPDHIHRGVFSTGAIVMTGPNEFVIDFVQNLGRPFQVVSRVVLPHAVMPQFVDALGKNIDLFRQRYGPLPIVTNRSEQVIIGNGPNPPAAPANLNDSAVPNTPLQLAQGAGSTPPTTNPSPQNPSPQNPSPQNPSAAGGSSTAPPPIPGTFSIDTNGGSSVSPLPPPNQPRRLSPQEIYDELKLRDDVLSGSYANAVMIGHGPYEFSFDFITNFYPQSAVSARVFVASGQVGLFYDSIKSTWDQFRQRMQGPQPPDAPPPSSSNDDLH